MMARYLYVLAMILVDRADGLRLGQSCGPRHRPMIVVRQHANPYQTQYALAQWAINCVDFRDRDSIMTPFEFDMNPSTAGASTASSALRPT